jgi:hypothetical protein
MRPMSFDKWTRSATSAGSSSTRPTCRAELYEMAQVIAGLPAWDGRSVAQDLHERRVAERRERRKVPEWFSAHDLLPEPWEREAAQAGLRNEAGAGRRLAAGASCSQSVEASPGAPVWPERPGYRRYIRRPTDARWRP